MKKILLPILLLLIGIGGGVGAGLVLIKPAEDIPVASRAPCGDPPEIADAHSTPNDAQMVSDDALGNEYAKLNNQFVVPIVQDGLVSAMVVMSLSVEVAAGNKEPVFLAEPKLRDAFLQAMFDHANIGGFDGNFTSAQNMRPLREDLKRLARSIVPNVAKDVLIVDIVRQDI